jgi:hypothetical protein
MRTLIEKKLCQRPKGRFKFAILFIYREEKKEEKKTKQPKKAKDSSPRSISNEREYYRHYYDHPYYDEDEDDRYVPFSKNRGNSRRTLDSEADPRGYGVPRGHPYARGRGSLEHHRMPPPGFMRGPPPGYYEARPGTGFHKRGGKNFD